MPYLNPILAATKVIKHTTDNIPISLILPSCHLIGQVINNKTRGCLVSKC